LLLLCVQSLHYLKFVFSDYFVQILIKKNQLEGLYGPKGLKNFQSESSLPVPTFAPLYGVLCSF